MPKKQLPLSKGLFAIVDEEDFERLSRLKWSAKPSISKFTTRVYASHSFRGEDRKMRHLLMHREILGAPQGVPVDHIDGDGLNNRRLNLRLCDRTQNMMNSQKYRKPIAGSQYKGVTWRKSGNIFDSRITVKRRTIHLGTFSTELLAAAAYDEAARKYFGQFAKLNLTKSEFE